MGKQAPLSYDLQRYALNTRYGLCLHEIVHFHSLSKAESKAARLEKPEIYRTTIAHPTWLGVLRAPACLILGTAQPSIGQALLAFLVDLFQAHMFQHSLVDLVAVSCDGVVEDFIVDVASGQEAFAVWMTPT